MKSVCIIVMAAILVLATVAVFTRAGEEPLTFTGQWNVARELAAEQTAIDPNVTSDFSELVTAANGWVKLPPTGQNALTSQANRIQLIAAADINDDKTFSYRIWAAANGNGPIEEICHGVGITGLRKCTHYPTTGVVTTITNWVDTFTVTEVWWGAVLSKADTALNGIAGLEIDMRGYTWFKIEITDAGGTASECAHVIWYYKFY